MLADFDHRLVVVVVDPPYETFVLVAKTFGLGRRVDAPIVGGLELQDNTCIDEAGESLFKDPSIGEGPDGGPLSLDRDLRGGIVGGLGGHIVAMRDNLRG